MLDTALITVLSLKLIDARDAFTLLMLYASACLPIYQMIERQTGRSS
jgi:hypothetical protein